MEHVVLCIIYKINYSIFYVSRGTYIFVLYINIIVIFSMFHSLYIILCIIHRYNYNIFYVSRGTYYFCIIYKYNCNIFYVSRETYKLIINKIWDLQKL